MGTPALAAASLQALLASPGLEMAAVVTQPDRPKGRQLKLEPTPVKQLALKHGLTVLQPERAKEETFVAAIRDLKPDLIAVAAYGQILPKALLEIPRLGCLNVHTSLLPRHRGAAPIQWAILNDDPETGVTIMKMDAGLDTGDILSEAHTAITESDDAQTLHDRLAELGAQLLVRTIPEYVEGKLIPRPQPAEGVTYARKITKEDGRLDWARPARELWNRVRGLVPWPVAYTGYPPSGAVLKIWRAEILSGPGIPGQIITADKTEIVVGCGEDCLRILQLQREGGRRLGPGEFLAGCRLQPGQQLARSNLI